jgi:GLPGLI family protein
MKTKLLLLLCLFAPVASHAQWLDEAIMQCQYRLVYIKDTLRPKAVTTDLMLLQIGKKISLFYSYKTFRVDSLLQVDVKNGLSVNEILAKKNAYGAKGATYNIVKNHAEKEIMVTDIIGTDNYKYTEPVENLSWELLPDTLTVAGYRCQKALCFFGGRHYEAWFTTAIPVSDGPWKFSGLPGLILKVQDTQKHYLFECTGLRNLRHPEPIRLGEKAYIAVSKKDFFKIEKRYREDPIEYLSNSSGIKVAVKGGIKVPKRSYNPIERQ